MDRKLRPAGSMREVADPPPLLRVADPLTYSTHSPLGSDTPAAEAMTPLTRQIGLNLEQVPSRSIGRFEITLKI